MSQTDGKNGGGGDDEEAALRKTLATLDVQRAALEHEADAIYLELTTPPEEGVDPMGVDTPLVDRDGYPRGDVDVYRARSLRNRFKVLQTDHKQLVGTIDDLLVRLAALKDPSKREQEAREAALRAAPKPKPKFDSLTGKWVVMNWDGTVAGVEGGDNIHFSDLSRVISDVTIPTLSTGDPNSVRDISSLDAGEDGAEAHHERDAAAPTRPFARIDAVAADSPAEAAGLHVEDLIVYFGQVGFANHNRLRAIAELVPDVAAEQGEVTIKLLRQQRGTENGDDEIYDWEDDPEKFEMVEVSLKPLPWSGRGLIGCHIVPYKPSSS